MQHDNQRTTTSHSSHSTVNFNQLSAAYSIGITYMTMLYIILGSTMANIQQPKRVNLRGIITNEPLKPLGLHIIHIDIARIFQ